MEKKDIVVLESFTPHIRDKFKIVQDVYEILSRYYYDNPIEHSDYLVKMRYPIGVEFFENFALNTLNYEEMNFALNVIYSYIGLNAVVDKIANFTGLKLRVSEIDQNNKKLTISIISENIFDLNLFEKKLTEFLKDVLLFSNLEFEFDVIVLTIKLNYNKSITSTINLQNITPLEVDRIQRI